MSFKSQISIPRRIPSNIVPKPSKKIILKSSDGKTFEVEEAIVVQFQTLKCMIKEDINCTEIPLPIVKSNILAKVIEYCNKNYYYKDIINTDDGVKAWDIEFISELDKETLFGLILAANFLGIKSLVDLAQQTVWGMIRPHTTKEIGKIYDRHDTVEDEFWVEYEWVVSDTNKSFTYSFLL